MSDKSRFLDTPGGVIQDTTNHIEWLPKDSYGDLGKWATLQESINYAHLMNQVYAGGHSDWHLPSKEEVLQLYDETLTQKDWEDSDINIDPVFVGGCSCYLWTNEKNDEGQALRIDLRTGDTEFIDPMTRDFQATRLVRSGK